MSKLSFLWKMFESLSLLCLFLSVSAEQRIRDNFAFVSYICYWFKILYTGLKIEKYSIMGMTYVPQRHFLLNPDSFLESFFL